MTVDQFKSISVGDTLIDIQMSNINNAQVLCKVVKKNKDYSFIAIHSDSKYSRHYPHEFTIDNRNKVEVHNG